MNRPIARETWDDVMASHSGISLTWGPTNIDRYLLDPKRLAFFMSRYKFAARMLERCQDIIDVGCGDGMGTLTFLSDTQAETVRGIDFEERCIDHAVEHLLVALCQARPQDVERLSFCCRDFMDGTVYATGVADGVCCLDVIEHVEPKETGEFIARIAGTLRDNGVAVVGTPNVMAAQYGSAHSQIGHINLFSRDMLRAEMEQQFRRVFMFAMNDEMVHTGFPQLAHYLIAVGVK